MSYIPKAGGLAARACTYFQANPDEELTRADVASKFEVPASSVDGLLAQCFVNGLLNRARDSDGAAVIVAGPKLKDLQLAAAPTSGAAALLTAPSTPPATATTVAAGAPAQGSEGKKRGGVRRRLPPLPIEKLVVAKGVPIPEPNRSKKGETRWDELFAKLKPNDSVAIPREYASAINKAMQVRAKAKGEKFVLRTVSETEARVWRTQ